MPGTKVDWLALLVSTLALALAAGSFIYTEFRGPEIYLAIGHDVLVTKTNNLGPRIGVICSLVNEGARQTIITDAALDIDSPKITLPLAMVGESFGGWEESGGVFKATPAKYNLAAPIPVRGHDKAAAIFWFVPVTSFEFTAGRHEFTLSATSQDGSWKRHFALDITPTDITNMGKTPYADHPISVVNQN
jgi:hypothetical protein